MQNLTYQRGLLTLLAQGPQHSATLATNKPLPNLSGFAADPADLEWVKTLPFEYQRLSAEYLIGSLIGMTRYSYPNSPVIQATFSAKMTVSPDSNELKDVSFKLTKTTLDGGALELKIDLL